MGTYYGPSWMKEIYYGLTDTKNWLYGPWNEEKYNTYLAFRNIPFFSNYMDYLLDQRRTAEYFKRNGMTYEDIHDPRKMFETNSGSSLYGSAFSFVSKNITRLYT